MVGSRRYILNSFRTRYSFLETGIETLDIDGAGLPGGKVSVAFCDTPSARIFFTSTLVNRTLRDGVVCYIDLDTLFTAYVTYEVVEDHALDDLVIFNPNGEEVGDAVATVCSIMKSWVPLVVLDSASMLHYLSSSRFGFGEANRSLSLYLALLNEWAAKRGSSVLVTSLARSRRRAGASDWSISYPGGRALRRFGQAMFELHTIEDGVEVVVLKHAEKHLEGRRYKVEASKPRRVSP